MYMIFKYSVEDNKNIDGLYRPWDDDEAPFLTPVFFEKECLVTFFYNQKYKCELFSETYGNISSEDFIISFGINKNNKVIFWLGDLLEIPEKEQMILIPYNVKSDHNINSDFYDAQINVKFTEPIKEIILIRQKDEINKKFSFTVFKNNTDNLDYLFNKATQYKRIMFENEDDFKRIISDLSEEIIEKINRSDLSKILNNNELGGIKLFEKYVKDKFNIEENIFNPYYVLYDLRIWADHRDGDKLFKYCLERLERNIDDEYSIIYNKLLEDLIKANSKLLEL